MSGVPGHHADRTGHQGGEAERVTKHTPSQACTSCNFRRGLLPALPVPLLHCPPAQLPQRHAHIRTPCECMLPCMRATDCCVSQVSGMAKSHRSCCDSSSWCALACRCTPPPHYPPLRALRTHRPGALVAPGSVLRASRSIACIYAMFYHMAATLPPTWPGFMFALVGATGSWRRAAATGPAHVAKLSDEL